MAGRSGESVFWTVLHNLNTPEDAGILVRAHVALGGAGIVLVGPEPWRFKSAVQFVRCTDNDSFLGWGVLQSVHPIAIEIASPPTFLPDFVFPPRPALIVGG